MTNAWHDRTRSIPDRARSLLAELSLREKVAQLGSYWLRPQDSPADDHAVAPMQAAFDAAQRPFEDGIRDGLGHLTRPFGSGPIDPADGMKQLARMQQAVCAGNRFGIPAIAHEECLTGFTTLGATCYPGPLAWGASFEPALVERMAGQIGQGMRAVGVHQGLAPVLDVVRDYRWGRVEEAIGEDPYLVGMLGVSYVTGLQNTGVMATLKHFVGYSAARAGRNHAPVSIGSRELSDVLLPPFEMAVRLARVASVMNSYSDLDGVPAGASTRLLTRILRGEWGFDGTVVSDYWSVDFLQSMHKVAPTAADAAVLAVRAGLDVELPETIGYSGLVDAVEDGRIDESVVDTSVLRVLRQKVALGLLDEQWQPVPSGDAPDLDPPASRDLARRMAERSVVLLANDGVLPLGDHRRIAVVGPSAVEPRTHLGCYSFINHVLPRWPSIDPGVELTSIHDALVAEFPSSEVRYERGTDFTDPDETGIAAAVELASSSDVVVVAVGDISGLFGAGTSGEGCDAPDLSLPGAQAALVDAVLDTGTPTVVVLVTGRPYAVEDRADRAAAVVQAFLPGEEGGTATAGVLSGRVNPSGRLPVGIPRHTGGQPGTYLTAQLGTWNEGVSNLDPRPAFPFGHGLSYTTFEHSDLRLSSPHIDSDGEVTVSSTVTNTGDRAGAEVVQLYLHDTVAQVVQPVKRLIGFVKVDLAPGDSRRVSFRMHADRTAFTGVDGRRIVEPGDFELSVGASSEDLPLTASLTITGPLRDVSEQRVLTTPVEVGPAAQPGDATYRTH